MSEQDAGLARPARTRRELREAAERARATEESGEEQAQRLLDAAQALPAAGAVPHPPSRPGWQCERCGGRPWPCYPARQQLATQFGTDRVGLSMYMGGRLAHAARELPSSAPDDLFHRFIAWTR